jgi:hypothetical protein
MGGDAWVILCLDVTYYPSELLEILIHNKELQVVLDLLFPKCLSHLILDYGGLRYTEMQPESSILVVSKSSSYKWEQQSNDEYEKDMNDFYYRKRVHLIQEGEWVFDKEFSLRDRKALMRELSFFFDEEGILRDILSDDKIIRVAKPKNSSFLKKVDLVRYWEWRF